MNNVNEDYFINCKTPESAYILGYLWGDGYLTKRTPHKKQQWGMKLECVKVDIDEIRPLFTDSGKWYYGTRHPKDRQEQALLGAYNKKLYEYFELYGYRDKSRIAPIILDNIPKKLHHYWWRGYSDADGCIYIHKERRLVQYSVGSTYEQDWSVYLSLLDSIKARYRIQKMIRPNGNRYSIITVSSKQSVVNLCNYFYSGKQFGLSRKLEKFNLIKEYFPNLNYEPLYI